MFSLDLSRDVEGVGGLPIFRLAFIKAFPVPTSSSTETPGIGGQNLTNECKKNPAPPKRCGRICV